MLWNRFFCVSGPKWSPFEKLGLLSVRFLGSFLLGVLTFSVCEVEAQQFPEFSDRTSERISRQSSLASNVTTLAEADYDNDGRIDLVVGMVSRRGVVLMNRGGVLTEEFQLPRNTAAEKVFPSDIDGDGFTDVLVASRSGGCAYFRNLGTDSNGTFLGFEDLSNRLPSMSMNAVSSGDIDGDGDNDILFCSTSSGTRDTILLNNGDGTFSDVGSRLASNWNTFKAKIIDLNGDGAPDILRQHNDDLNQIDYNNGDGTFTQAGSLPRADNGFNVPLAYTMVHGDFNADGLPDIVSLNDGTATYTFSDGLDSNSRTRYTTQGFRWPRGLHEGHGYGDSGDIDGDGDMDFVIACSDVLVGQTVAPRGMMLAINQDNGTLINHPSPGSQAWGQLSGTIDARLMDLNNDGNLDIILASTSGVNVYMNNAPPRVIEIVNVEHPISNPGIEASFTATITGGNNPQFRWDFGDGQSEVTSTASTTHIYNSPGRYFVTLTVADERNSSQSQFFHMVAPEAVPGKAVTSMSIIYEELADGDRIWTVNPDHNSVSVFQVDGTRLAEIPVGDEPRTLAYGAPGVIYVVNRESASISLISTTQLSEISRIPLPRGSRPYGLVMDPAEQFAYVSAEDTNEILKLDLAQEQIVDRLSIGNNPRHLAMAADGQRLLVPSFITPKQPGEDTPNIDTSGGGDVHVIDLSSFAEVITVKIAFSPVLIDSATESRGVPNYLGGPAISPDGRTAWVPSKLDNIVRGIKRDGEFRIPDMMVRSIVSRINLENLSEDLANRVDIDNSSPSTAAVFGPYGIHLFIAHEGGRNVSILNAYDGSRLAQIEVGFAPQGLAISPDGTRLYVQNFLGRSISVLDTSQLISGQSTNVEVIDTFNVSDSEPLSPEILLGKRLFFDASDNRLATQDYISCASCHDSSGHDGRIWDFTDAGEGLRNTIDLRGRRGTGHGNFHWTGNFDEVHDFENDIRDFFGGSGLMTNEDFAETSDILGPAKAGRSSDLDALSAYVTSLDSFGVSPHRSEDGSLTTEGLAGREIFITLNCARCHGGDDFTDSAQNKFHDIGTIDSDTGNRLGSPLSGLDTPTLRGLWNGRPYLHDGSADTLAEAVRAHINVNVNVNDQDLNLLVEYLKQIDDREPGIRANGSKAPVLLAIPNQSAALGQVLTIPILVSDADTDINSITIQVNGLPDGLSFDSGNNTITGAAADAGDFLITILATDEFGSGLPVSFSMTVSQTSIPALTLTSPENLQSSTTGPWILGNVIEVTQATTITHLGLIDGNANGQLEGIRDVAIWRQGNSQALAVASIRSDATVEDGVFYAGIQPLTLPPGMYIIAGVFGQNNEAWFFENGTTPTNQVSVPGVSIQQGIYLSSNNLVMPTQLIATRFYFGTAFKVQGGGQLSEPPTLDIIATQSATVGASISYQTSASDPDDDPLVYVASGLPSGLSIDSDTGLISGTPVASGNFNTTIVVYDRRGQSDQVSFLWGIEPAPNSPPVLASIGDQTGTIGQSVSLTLSATDDDGDTMVFSASGLPDGLNLNGGNISGNPTSIGTFSTIISVSDGNGGTDSETIRWTIEQVPVAQPPYSNGFEADQLVWGSDGVSQIIQNAAEAHEGEYFLRIPAASDRTVVRYLALPDNSWQHGKSYALEFFGRLSVDAIGSGEAGFTFYDENYNQLSSANAILSSQSWSQYLTGPVVAPSNAVFVEFWALKGAGSGYADFDTFEWLDMDENPIGPTVELSVASSSVSGPFEVLVSFSQPVTGLTGLDFQITNGEFVEVVGDGDMYTLKVTPLASPVSLMIGENRVQNADGVGNQASSTLTLTYSSQSGETVFQHGFEQGQPDWGNDGLITVISDESQAPEGMAFLDIQSQPDTTTVSYLPLPAELVVAGTEYTLLFQGRLSNDATGYAVAGLTFFDPDYNVISNGYVSRSLAGSIWQNYSTDSILVPENAKYAEIWALIGTGVGSAFFDDFSIQTPMNDTLDLRFDGELSDWVGVKPLAKDNDDTEETIDILTLHGIYHNDRFHLAIENQGPIGELNWGYTWYLDTDQNPTTGFAQNNVGADYMIQGNRLYQFVGLTQDVFQWSEVAQLQALTSNNTAEYILDPALIGDVSDIDIIFWGYNVVFGGTEIDIVPDVGVVTLSKSSAPQDTILVDGDFSDWPESSFEFLDGDDINGFNAVDVLSMRLHSENGNLYVGYINESPLNSLVWSYSLFLDVDNDSTSGFYVESIGAEYLIQNNTIYRYNGVNGAWSWVNASQATLAIAGNQVEYAVKLSDIGDPVSLPFLLLADNAAFGSGDGIDILGGNFELSSPQSSRIRLQSVSSSAAAETASQVELAIAGQYPAHAVKWLGDNGHSAVRADVWDQDSDGDGYSNLAEYAAGSDPNNNLIKPIQHINLHEDSQGGYIVILRQAIDAGALVSYQLEESTDLDQWNRVAPDSWISMEESGGEVIWKLNQDQQERFFRVGFALDSLTNQEL